MMSLLTLKMQTLNEIDCNRVRVQLQSLDIQATIECGFTLKRVRHMTRTYSQSLFYISGKGNPKNLIFISSN